MRTWRTAKVHLSIKRADSTDVMALHIFRIRGKDLRYAMEVLAGASPDEFRTRLYPAVESMQKLSGIISSKQIYC